MRLQVRTVGVHARLLQLLLMAENIVLFICVENAGRSLMAEAMFNARAPEGWRAESAGTRPAPHPNARTAPMLREVGLEAPRHAPRFLTVEMMEAAAFRITMGCLDDESCPAKLRTLPLTDWGYPDPARLDDEGFRRVRDQIMDRVKGFVAEIYADEKRRAGHPKIPGT